MKVRNEAVQGRCPLPGELLEMTINEAALSCPHVLEVFGRHGMDTCCGGSLQVRTAAARHGVDPADLALELANVAMLAGHR